MKPTLAKILVYPIKSLDPVMVPQIHLQAGGSLAYDREWALFDRQGHYVNGKRYPQVHQLRAEFNLDLLEVTFNQQVTFHLSRERLQLERWCGDYFGFPVTLDRQQIIGFPDDVAAWGPTLVSEQSLVTVAQWFPGMSSQEVRLRFRANLELSGVPAFWEDSLLAGEAQTCPFQLGTVAFEGVNPCTRCIVPTRAAQTGEAWQDFQKIFSAQRQASLPDRVPLERFQHFYKFTLNTRISPNEAGKMLRVGDTLTTQEVTC
jgi:uncharacterized protein YcbX